MNTKRKTLKMPVRYLMNLVLVGLLFVGLSYVTGNMLSTYQNKVLLTVGINIILAVSLNVATGYLGQLPLGHAGFMAVGAYACALFTKSSGLPKGVAFAIGLVLAAGLDGIEHRMILQAPINKNLFDPAEAAGLGLERLPSTLEEAVQAAQESEFLHRVLPEELSHRYYEEELKRCAALKAAADPAEYERIHYFNAI